MRAILIFANILLAGLIALGASQWLGEPAVNAEVATSVGKEHKSSAPQPKNAARSILSRLAGSSTLLKESLRAKVAASIVLTPSGTTNFLKFGQLRNALASIRSSPSGSSIVVRLLAPKNANSPIV